MNAYLHYNKRQLSRQIEDAISGITGQQLAEVCPNCKREYPSNYMNSLGYCMACDDHLHDEAEEARGQDDND